MNPEIEATFVNINKDDYRAKLRSVGARLAQPETMMKRVVFDLDDRSFIRVRDEGKKIHYLTKK